MLGPTQDSASQIAAAVKQIRNSDWPGREQEAVSCWWDVKKVAERALFSYWLMWPRWEVSCLREARRQPAQVLMLLVNQGASRQVRLLEEEEKSAKAVGVPGRMGDTQVLAEEVLEQAWVVAGRGLPISPVWCG